MSGWLVGKGEFTQVSSDHVELDLHWVENFSAVNTDDVTNHFWHNDAVSKVSFDCGGLFTGLTVLLCLFAFHIESVISVFDF
jgi:hypothetical protein